MDEKQIFAEMISLGKKRLQYYEAERIIVRFFSYLQGLLNPVNDLCVINESYGINDNKMCMELLNKLRDDNWTKSYEGGINIRTSY